MYRIMNEDYIFDDFIEHEDDSKDSDFTLLTAALSKPDHAKKSRQRKLAHKWTHDQVVQLITLVEQKRGVWDTGSSEYKTTRLDCWRNIVKELNVEAIDVNEVKTKWMNLRLTFKNKLRAKKSGQGANETVPITWKYFPLMKFLHANDIQQSTHPMFLPDVSTDVSNFNDSAFMSTNPTSSTAFRTTNVGQRRKRGTSATPTPPTLPTSSNSSTKQMATELLSSALATLNKRDKHSAFGEFIAQELRSLPPHESEVLRANLIRTLLASSESCPSPVLQQKPQQSSPFQIIDDEEPHKKRKRHDSLTALAPLYEELTRTQKEINRNESAKGANEEFGDYVAAMLNIIADNQIVRHTKARIQIVLSEATVECAKLELAACESTPEYKRSPA